MRRGEYLGNFEPVDRVARLVLALSVFFPLIGLAKRVARELIFSRR